MELGTRQARYCYDLGGNADRRFECYQTVLPCTLCLPLQAIWENVVVDFPLQANTIATFHEQLKRFFAANCSENDHHELIECIHKATKPHSLCVQAFFYRLRELNVQASWLPGQAVILTPTQLDQAFYDGMPVSWRNCYSNAGCSIQHDNRAELLRFFRQKESQADKTQRDNNDKQRTDKSKRRREAASNRFNNKAQGKNKDDGDEKKCPNKRPKCNGKNKKKGKDEKITVESKSPIHPKGNHTWGECFQNIANADKPKPTTTKKGKKDKDKDAAKPAIDGHALQASTPEENSLTSVASVNSDDAPIIRAINDHPFGPDKSYKSNIKDLCDKLNFGLGKPDELLAEFRAKHPSRQGKFEAFVSLQEPFTHHFDDLDLAVPQPSPNVPYNEIVDNYVHYIDESYSLGVSDSSIEQNFDVQLQLHATSYALVQTMQKTQVNRLLRVLFDSGSDKTMLKRSALPLGLNPSKGQKHTITGVTSSAVTNQEVMIDNMTLPEFSSTRRVSGPICVIIMDHNDAPYDLIIGIGLLQTLGIDIHNMSKTVIWDNIRIPFKPQDYFTNHLFTNNLSDAMAISIENIDDPLDLGYKSKYI